MYTLLRVGMSPRSNIIIITIVDYYTKSPKVCGHMYITKLQWCGMCLSTKVYVMQCMYEWKIVLYVQNQLYSPRQGQKA